MKRHLAFTLWLLIALIANGAKSYTLTSPDGRLSADITTADGLMYSITFDGKTILNPSPAALTLSDGSTVGNPAKITGSARRSVDSTVESPFYRANSIAERYNELTLNLGKNWAVVFRAYNDGIAYRFVSKAKKPFRIAGETVDYRFTADVPALVPYVKKKEGADFETQFHNSFENIYTAGTLSQLDPRRLMFLPLMTEPAPGVKMLITESALIDYPGMYLNKGTAGNSLKGVFAPYPKTLKQGGHNQLQMLVTEREDYIARIDSPRALPWRIAIVADNDAALAASNLSYLLGEPSRVADISWIKPGKVAWDWWNNWNIDGVDFEAGINNDTYKAYIDFAAKNGIEYVILDEGWAVNLKADLMQVVDEINLKELVDYAAERNVGIILWAGFHAFDRDMENVCRHYSEMGVKGFKVDFMDRDDQMMTGFNARAAEMAAKYHLILDLHGTHKPAGLNRTYPNVLNFEGVNGLEQLKWSPKTHDQVTYDVQIPFLRQASGPMDYTQGAMRNAIRKNYYPCSSEPMSQGTRCRQLALYTIFDSPFNMLCDNPSNYMREQECTDFIAAIPTVWDETVILDGKVGEYIVTARRKGDVWYIGGITDWTPRDIEIDCSFLAPGRQYTADMFTDGVNAHRAARDYRRTSAAITDATRLKVHLAPGGGFTARLR